ncbi:MAG: DUF433 domain-containing protein [Hyphomicrobiaceae bacterium]
MSAIRVLTADGFVVSNPHILGGTPCIVSTRLNIYAIAARYRGGETAEEILDGYPDLPPAHVLAAVAHAEANPQVEHPDARPWRNIRAKTGAN